VAVATSSAAEDDSPPPSGTVDSTTASNPHPPGGKFTLHGVDLRAAAAELGLPPDARDWGNAKILAHLWDAQQQGQLVRRVKLIFVGHGGGGKTTLVQRLRTGAFADQPGATDGVEVAEWTEGALGPEITFAVLDCGMRARGTCTPACPCSLACAPLPLPAPQRCMRDGQ